MKTNNNKREFGFSKFPYASSIKSFVLCAFILVGFQTAVQAQEDSVQYTKPSWFFGVAAGGNINFYRGSTQQLNASLSVPTTFHDGSGVGLFVAPLVEYRPADSRWGVMFQVGYDSRRGSFTGVTTPCNCPADLITDLSYLTVEPSLRFAPFKSSLYLYAGPRLGFNNTKSFTYSLGVNPDVPDQAATPDVKGDFSSIRPNLLSMQIGAGFDIPLSSQKHKTQFVLSPFVSFQPYFGQDPRSIETWNITTLRVGAALKLGTGHRIAKPVKEVEKKAVVPVVVPVVEPELKVNFVVNSPSNEVHEGRVREIFPLRNYVFFDLGSTQISRRYTLLKKDEVQNFKEDELEMKATNDMSGRSARQMKVYYNILNILGERMSKDPSTTVVLVGSSLEGNRNGRAMAESVKKYLVTIFEIDENRINTQGRNRPILPSGSLYGNTDRLLVNEGDRRVTIETSSPALLMEFRSGADAPLRPVAINGAQVAPKDSYVTFNVGEANTSFNSWSMEITNEVGHVQYYGPYTEQSVSIPGNTLLGDRAEGDFKVQMIANLKTSKVVVKNTTMHVKQWKASNDADGMRFSIIYEFNKSNATTLYRKYLTEVVTPKIPRNGTVIIHGHTDAIGNEAYNKQLSLARANDVKNILQEALRKVGRSNVTFDVSGLGEDPKTEPFENKYPEERFYNRTVIIDIAPAK